MPIYVRPPSRPRLVSTCDLLPRLCQSDPSIAPFQHHPTNLAHQFTINTRQSASSSNSHKAAGDNMSMTSLMQPDYPSRFAPSPAPMSHQRP
ncbi:hypothetical protein HRG_014605 [Hirsutella rhossiliensis]